jgi:hypothetical protein
MQSNIITIIIVTTTITIMIITMRQPIQDMGVIVMKTFILGVEIVTTATGNAQEPLAGRTFGCQTVSEVSHLRLVLFL